MESLCPYYWVYPPAKDVRNEDEKELTVLMKEATLELHETSDDLVNVKLLLALTDREEYGKALGLFYCVFQCIDEAMQKHLLQMFRTSNFEVLLSSRIKAFENDLEVYLGPQWASIVGEQCRPHAEFYCAHLETLAEREAVLLIPYAYHLSLALLAGGQTIKKLAQKAFTKSEASVQVFEYALVTKRFEAKQGLKQFVNELELGKDVKTRFIQHSAKCFDMNNHMIKSYYAQRCLWRQIVHGMVTFFISLRFSLFLAFVCVLYMLHSVVLHTHSLI